MRESYLAKSAIKQLCLLYGLQVTIDCTTQKTCIFPTSVHWQNAVNSLAPRAQAGPLPAVLRVAAPLFAHCPFKILIGLTLRFVQTVRRRVKVVQL